MNPSADAAREVTVELPDDVGWLCQELERSPEGCRLLVRSPALAAATALRAGTGVRWAERLLTLLTLPPRALAEHLGFGRSRASLRTLARLPASNCTPQTLEELALLLRGPRIKWVHHLPALCSASVSILAAPGRRAVATYALLEELALDLDPDMQELLVITLDEILWMREAVTPRRMRAPIRSCDALFAEERDLIHRLEERQGVLPFPFRAPPPLPVRTDGGTTVRFEPLGDLDSVRRHGLDQDNCLGRSPVLLRGLLSGDLSLYRVVATPTEVTGPLVATLSVSRDGGALTVRELLLHRNSRPPDWLTEGVAAAVRAAAGA